MRRGTDAFVAIPSTELARVTHPTSRRMHGTVRAVLRVVLGALDEEQKGVECTLASLIGDSHPIFGGGEDTIRLRAEVPQYEELREAQVEALSDEARLRCFAVEGGALAHSTGSESRWKNAIAIVDSQDGTWQIAMRRERTDLLVIFQDKAGALVTHRSRVVPPVLINQLFDESSYTDARCVDAPWFESCTKGVSKPPMFTPLPVSVVGRLCSTLRRGLPMMALFMMADGADSRNRGDGGDGGEDEPALRPLLIERGALLHKAACNHSGANATHRIRLWVHLSTARCACCAIDPTAHAPSTPAASYVTIDLTFCGDPLCSTTKGPHGSYRCCARHPASRQHEVDVGTFPLRCIDNLTVHLRCMHAVDAEGKRFQCRKQRTLPFMPANLWDRVRLGILCSAVLDIHEHIQSFRPERNVLESVWERQLSEVGEAMTRIDAHENRAEEDVEAELYRDIDALHYSKHEPKRGGKARKHEEHEKDEKDEEKEEKEKEEKEEEEENEDEDEDEDDDEDEDEDEEAYHRWRANRSASKTYASSTAPPAELLPTGAIPGHGSSTQVDAARLISQLMRKGDIFASRGSWKHATLRFSGVGKLKLRQLVITSKGKLEWKRSKRLEWAEEKYASAFPLVSTLKLRRANGYSVGVRQYDARQMNLSVFV